MEIAGSRGWSGFRLICREMVIENRDALSIRASRLIEVECEFGSKAVG